MVCYVRPVCRLAAVILVVFVVFGRPVRSFFGTADLMAAVAVATAGAALAAVLIAVTVLATRRRRAAGGGCVTCRFQCQHAMTGPPGRSWLVSTVDRGQARQSGPAAAHPAPAGGPGTRPLLPIQPVAPTVVRAAIRAEAPRPTPASAQYVTPTPARAAIRAEAPRSVRNNGFEDFEGVPAGPVPSWPDRPIHRASQALSGQRAT